MLSTSWQQAKNHSDMEEKQCHGLILFLAELVIQMESVLAVSLGKLLVQLISGVLMNPTPNSAKNICQALKVLKNLKIFFYFYNRKKRKFINIFNF